MMQFKNILNNFIHILVRQNIIRSLVKNCIYFRVGFFIIFKNFNNSFRNQVCFQHVFSVFLITFAIINYP